MPLVVPGITSNPKESSSSTSQKPGEASNQDWLSKLAGKKIGDKHDETTFAKKDLPSEHRILEPESFRTLDSRKDRLNVETDKEGKVHNVHFG